MMLVLTDYRGWGLGQFQKLPLHSPRDTSYLCTRLDCQVC